MRMPWCALLLPLLLRLRLWWNVAARLRAEFRCEVEWIARAALYVHPVTVCSGAVARGGLSNDFNGERRANHPRLSLDDDDVKVGLRRTFSNSSCGSFSSDAAFKSELLSGEDQYLAKDTPFQRRHNHITDIDDVASASHLIDSKPSPLLLPQHSPTLQAMRSPPLLTSPGAPFLFTQWFFITSFRHVLERADSMNEIW
jgi:hypothetical protein